MKNVAFYFDKPGFEPLDYSSFFQGNPGMGGSEYEFLLVSQLLRNRGVINTILLSRTKFSPIVSYEYVENLDETCQYCLNHNIDILVVNPKLYDDISEAYKKRLDFVLWAHNDMPRLQMDKVSKDDAIKKVVFCGREFLELYYDSIIMRKSTYIYNIFPFNKKEWYLNKIADRNNHNVVYMGSITYQKGFHVLAKAWPEILKKVPDAHLYVIGSGQLYDKTTSMGKYGIAKKDYEERFVKYLIDEKGNILSNVHFMGVLGKEKFDIIGKCKVGVPNPTGKSECLPITTIEMQLMGCSMTTIKHPAYLDTIYNQHFLYKNINQLSDYVVNRLLKPRDNYDELYKFILDRFDIEKSLQRWEYMLSNINEITIERYSTTAYHCKPLKAFLLRCKMVFPLFCMIPTVERIYSLVNRFKNR